MLSASRSQRLTLLLADLSLGEKRLQNFQKKTPDFLTAGLWLERGDGRGSSHQSRDVWGNCLCRLGHQGWETLQGTASAASAWCSSSGLSPVAPTRALGRLDRDPPPRSGRGLLGSAPAAGGLGELQTRERGRGRWQHPGEDLLGAEGTPLPARAARGRGVPVLPPPLDALRDQMPLGERRAEKLEPEPGGLRDSGRRAAGAGGLRGAGFPQPNPPETHHLLLDRPLRPPRRAGLDLAERLPPGPGQVLTEP